MKNKREIPVDFSLWGQEGIIALSKYGTKIRTLHKCPDNEDYYYGLFEADKLDSFVLHIQNIRMYQESQEAILFAEWLSENEWVKRTATHPNKVGQYYSHKHCEYKKIEDLFELFTNR